MAQNVIKCTHLGVSYVKSQTKRVAVVVLFADKEHLFFHKEQVHLLGGGQTALPSSFPEQGSARGFHDVDVVML